MSKNDLESVARLAMLANSHAEVSSYGRHIVEELEENPDLSFVAEDIEGIIPGYAQGDIYGEIGVIEDIAVSESYQGRGITSS